LKYFPLDTKFSASWLSSVDVNDQSVGEWCRKGKDGFHGNNQAKLLVTASAPSTSSNSSSNRNSSANVRNFNNNDASLTAEIYWLAKMESFSSSSADHIGDRVPVRYIRTKRYA